MSRHDIDIYVVPTCDFHGSEYIGDYFKILSGKNQGKKMIREIALFHFPIFSYLKYRY